MVFTRLLLYLASAGLACSAGFLILVLKASFRFRRGVKATRQELDTFPPVTLLKPLCGLEPNLELNLESFFRQQYPKFEIIFGTRNSNDPALNVVRDLRRLYPRVPVKIVSVGEPDSPNAKVCSLMKMYESAAYNYFIISDSDVKVDPSYVREVVRPLLDPEIGLVTCLYRGVPTGGFWSKMEALGMSVEMTSGVLVAELLEGMEFALGPTMGIRRDVLDSIGGFGILADYCADDYVLGAAVHESGRRVVLSDHVIDHVVINRCMRSSFLHQVRWMKSTRFSRSMGHIASVLTFAMPFGIIAVLAAFALHRPLLGIGLLLTAYLNRVVMSLAAGRMVVRDPRALGLCWLYPLRDLMGFGFWCASFFGREIVWRGESYRLESGGRMELCGSHFHSGRVIHVRAEDVDIPVVVDHVS